MKTKTTILIGMITACLLLSACSSIDNFSIEKRRYSNGYYVDGLSKKHKNKTVEQTAVVKHSAVEPVQKVSPIVPGEIAGVVESPLSAELTIAANNNDKAAGANSSGLYAHNTMPFKSETFASNTGAEVKMNIVQKLAFKKLSKSMAKAGKSGSASTAPEWLIAVLCVLLPPLAVYLRLDTIGTEFWISILLTLLFWLPGVIYAFVICF